tara:strand:+ start:298 stop:477 length:180 start_codon:yes stop_codon:yes gene_type:complete
LAFKVLPGYIDSAGNKSAEKSEGRPSGVHKLLLTVTLKLAAQLSETIDCLGHNEVLQLG